MMTKNIRKNKDHWEFLRHRIERYSRTVAIFHIKRTAKNTLSYLASKRPWGLSEKEAKELLGRDCKRPLRELEKNNSIQSSVVSGDRIYLNRVNKKADIQVKERRINPRFRTEEQDEYDEEKIGYIKYEDFCKTFKEAFERNEGPMSSIG